MTTQQLIHAIRNNSKLSQIKQRYLNNEKYVRIGIMTIGFVLVLALFFGSTTQQQTVSTSNCPITSPSCIMSQSSSK